jgi:site-specific DNA recombinase
MRAHYPAVDTLSGANLYNGTLHSERDLASASLVAKAHRAVLLPIRGAGLAEGGVSFKTKCSIAAMRVCQHDTRPALQQLLADIRDGKVDVVVVYKIDRLTRSLFDFAKIVEAFDARGVSFVSITQQFNTTTSMGQLTLNVLLSFAQFEREVAGERIRDKIAASKKKGMWMGGLPSLGYDVENRKLVVNDDEARTVIHIFRRYVELKSVRALKEELEDAGIRSKQRIFADGTKVGGQKPSRGALYLMLQNRIYRGDITHKGTAYPGEHQPIIDETLWDQVQVTLAENRVDRAIGADAKQPSLLAGLIFDETGERLSPSHAVKKGTRYRYYVSRSLIVGAAKDKPSGRRIPAGNLEGLVINRLRDFLADQGAILNAIDKQHTDGARQNRLISRGCQIAEELPTMAPERIRAMLMALLSRVDIKPNRVEIAVRRSCLIELLNIDSIDLTILGDRPEHEAKDILTLKVPARLQRVGREMKMLVENSDDQTEADPGLLRIVARAHDLQELLMQNKGLTRTPLPAKSMLRPVISRASCAFLRSRPTSLRRSSTARIRPSSRPRNSCALRWNCPSTGASSASCSASNKRPTTLTRESLPRRTRRLLSLQPRLLKC